MEKFIKLIGRNVCVAKGDKLTPRIVTSIFSIEGSDGSLIPAVYSLSPKQAISAGYLIMTRGIAALFDNLIIKCK